MSAISYQGRVVTSLWDRVRVAWFIASVAGIMVGAVTLTLSVVFGLASSLGFAWQGARDWMFSATVVAFFPAGVELVYHRTIWTVGKLGRVLLVDAENAVLWLWTAGKVGVNVSLLALFFGTVTALATGSLAFVGWPVALLLASAAFSNYWAGVAFHAGLDSARKPDLKLTLSESLKSETAVLLSWVFVVALAGVSFSAVALVIGLVMWLAAGSYQLAGWSEVVLTISLISLFVLVFPLGAMFSEEAPAI